MRDTIHPNWLAYLDVPSVILPPKKGWRNLPGGQPSDIDRNTSDLLKKLEATPGLIQRFLEAKPHFAAWPFTFPALPGVFFPDSVLALRIIDIDQPGAWRPCLLETTAPAGALVSPLRSAGGWWGPSLADFNREVAVAVAKAADISPLADHVSRCVVMEPRSEYPVHEDIPEGIGGWRWGEADAVREIIQKRSR